MPDDTRTLYAERAALFAALAKHHPSAIDPTDPDPNGRIPAYIELPTGQISIHVDPQDMKYFTHTPTRPGYTWDKHSTGTKLTRLAKYTQR